jgi:hypothetical protein
MIKPYFHVIMPIGSDRAFPIKQEIIRQIAKTYNLEAHFPNYSSSKPVFAIRQTMEDLRGSLFVIADLSLERPSCYYELGIAESLGKKVFIIAQSGTDIHQTMNREYVQFYQDLSDFKEVLRGTIQNHGRVPPDEKPVTI